MDGINDMKIEQVLQQIRSMAAAAQGGEKIDNEASKGVDFSTMLKGAVDQVNETQQNAAAMAQAMEMGDPNVDLTDVMVNLQKANISFQAMVQVRNKLVAAYQDIMNMPV